MAGRAAGPAHRAGPLEPGSTSVYDRYGVLYLAAWVLALAAWWPWCVPRVPTPPSGRNAVVSLADRDPQDRAWNREPSEPADVPSCLIRRFGHVDAIGPASRRRKRGQPVRGPFEESLRPDLVPPSSMGERNADLRKSLPQIRLLGRSSFPTRFEDLMGCERAASVDELSSLPERLLRRQGFLRHRLDAPGAIGQWPAQRVSRPCLTSTTLGVPITLSSSHTTSVPEKRSPDRLLSASYRRVPRAVMQMCAPALDP